MQHDATTLPAPPEISNQSSISSGQKTISWFSAHPAKLPTGLRRTEGPVCGTSPPGSPGGHRACTLSSPSQACGLGRRSSGVWRCACIDGPGPCLAVQLPSLTWKNLLIRPRPIGQSSWHATGNPVPWLPTSLLWIPWSSVPTLGSWILTLRSLRRALLRFLRCPWNRTMPQSSRATARYNGRHAGNGCADHHPPDLPKMWRFLMTTAQFCWDSNFVVPNFYKFQSHGLSQTSCLRNQTIQSQSRIKIIHPWCLNVFEMVHISVFEVFCLTKSLRNLHLPRHRSHSDRSISGGSWKFWSGSRAPGTYFRVDGSWHTWETTSWDLKRSRDKTPDGSMCYSHIQSLQSRVRPWNNHRNFSHPM